MPELSRVPAQDLYELLEVSSSASQEVIQAAYHVLARVWHPDVNKNPDAARRIRELNGAYQVLGDGQQRAIYDLQRARIRRRERMLGTTTDRPLPAPGAGRRSYDLPARRAAQPAALVATHDRRPLLSGQTLLVLAVVAALVAAALLLVWVGLVLSDEPQMGNPGVLVEMQRGIPLLDTPTR